MPKKVLYSISDFNLKDKNVFIRTDFNVPVKNNVVSDHIRLQSSLQTIRYALKQKAHVIIASHRGRPQNRQTSIQDKKNFTLAPFGHYLSEVLNCEVIFIEDIAQPVPQMLIRSLDETQIMLLENMRFHPDEVQGGVGLAKTIASYIDIYINEAFSVSHRPHTSICTLANMLKHKGEGLSFKKEKQVLDNIRDHASSPLALVIGGGPSKISDKIKIISRLMDRIDILMVGGAMAYSFLKALGASVGLALVSKADLPLITEIIHRLNAKEKQLLLPIDHIVVSNNTNHSGKKVMTTTTNRVPQGTTPVDIGPKTMALFAKNLQKAKTIFWNGPMGKFEQDFASTGTQGLCHSFGECTQAFRVAGGGDSIAAIVQFNCSNNFDYISTGGGAALKYLETGTLPGLKSLMTTPSCVANIINDAE